MYSWHITVISAPFSCTEFWVVRSTGCASFSTCTPAVASGDGAMAVGGMSMVLKTVQRHFARESMVGWPSGLRRLIQVSLNISTRGRCSQVILGSNPSSTTFFFFFFMLNSDSISLLARPPAHVATGATVRRRALQPSSSHHDGTAPYRDCRWRHHRLEHRLLFESCEELPRSDSPGVKQERCPGRLGQGRWLPRARLARHVDREPRCVELRLASPTC